MESPKQLWPLISPASDLEAVNPLVKLERALGVGMEPNLRPS